MIDLVMQIVCYMFVGGACVYYVGLIVWLFATAIHAISIPSRKFSDRAGDWTPVSKGFPEEREWDDGYVEPSDHVLVYGRFPEPYKERRTNDVINKNM